MFGVFWGHVDEAYLHSSHPPFLPTREWYRRNFAITLLMARVTLHNMWKAISERRSRKKNNTPNTWCRKKFLRSLGSCLFFLFLFFCSVLLTWLSRNWETAAFTAGYGAGFMLDFSQTDRERNRIVYSISQWFVRQGESLHNCPNAECFHALDLSDSWIQLFNVSLHCAILSYYTLL